MSEQSLQVTSPNSLISKKELEFAERVNEIIKQTSQIALIENQFTRGLMMANAMQQIEKALTEEIMAPVNKLFGSPIGIRCDKKDYGDDVKKRIFIEATLGGWSIVGNQINVIGGNMYITKQGYLPRLRSIDGLTFTYPFKHEIPVSDPNTLTTTVTTLMEWTWKNKANKEIVKYPVTRNSGQSNDAVLGKADTKMCRWLWNKITGQETIDDGGGYTDAVVISSEPTPIKNEPSSNESTKVEGKISEELQKMFDTYIAKSTGKEDLINKAKTWMLSKRAVDSGASFEEVDGSLKSTSVDLSKFYELQSKF